MSIDSENNGVVVRIQTPKNDGRSKPRPMTAFKRSPAKTDEKQDVVKSSFDVLQGTENAEINQSDEKATVKARPKTASVSAVHRRYDPVYPTANKLLAKIWDDNARRRHLAKLGSIKPKVDNHPPKVHVHLASRFKKTQQEEENNKKIKRENQILEERLRRRLHESEGFSSLNPRFLEGLKLLRQRKRNEDRNRIHQENLNLIQRVEDRKPFYQKKAWSDDRKKNLAYLLNISRFPEVYVRPKTNSNQSEETKEKCRSKSAQSRVSSSAGEVHTTRSVTLRIEFLKKKELINARKEQDLHPRRKISSAA